MYWKVEPAMHSSSMMTSLQRQGSVHAMQQPTASAELLPDLCISKVCIDSKQDATHAWRSYVTAFTRLRTLRVCDAAGLQRYSGRGSEGCQEFTNEGGKVAFVLVSGNVIVDVWHVRVVLQVK